VTGDTSLKLGTAIGGGEGYGWRRWETWWDFSRTLLREWLQMPRSLQMGESQVGFTVRDRSDLYPARILVLL